MCVPKGVNNLHWLHLERPLAVLGEHGHHCAHQQAADVQIRSHAAGQGFMCTASVAAAMPAPMLVRD